MTHKGEELQYDISKLWYQVQKISILQREIKDDIDGLKAQMEAKMDDLKDQMKANMDYRIAEYHIDHQQHVIQLSKYNLTLVQNRIKQREDQNCSEISFEVVTETRTQQLPNRSIFEYLSKWKDLPVEDSTWEDENFIQKHPEIIKR